MFGQLSNGFLQCLLSNGCKNSVLVRASSCHSGHSGLSTTCLSIRHQIVAELIIPIVHLHVGMCVGSMLLNQCRNFSPCSRSVAEDRLCAMFADIFSVSPCLVPNDAVLLVLTDCSSL